MSTLTGTEALILVVSDTGLVYTYATPRLRPVIDGEKGRAFITASLKGELEGTTPSVATIKRQLNQEEATEMGREEIVVDSALDYPASSSFIGGLFASHIDITGSSYRLPPLPAAPNPTTNNTIYSLSEEYPAVRTLSTTSTSTSPLPPPLPLPLPPPLLSHLNTSPPRLQPPLLYHSADHVQTPYERAAAEHARAFANYRAQVASIVPTPGAAERYPNPLPVTLPLPHSGSSSSATSIFSNATPASAAASRAPVFGSHNFSDVARHWKIPVDHMGNGRSFRGERERSGSVSVGEGMGMGNRGEEMEERKRRLREEREREVSVAKEVCGYSSFL